MWTVHLPKRVQQELEAAPSELTQQIRETLEHLQQTPRPPNCKKLKGRLQCWRVRVGTYRILYDIFDRERVIVITKIGPRKNVYR